MKKEKIAPFSVLLAGILWGCMGIFVRRLDAWGLSSMQMVGLRSVLTTVVLLIVLGITDRDALKIRWKDLWCFFGTGVLSIVFFSYCYFQTILLTGLSVAAVLLYTAPAMVMVMSAFLFRERFTSIKVISIVLAFAGCVLVTGLIGSNVHLSTLGVITGLGSGFGYALYSIFSRFALQRQYRSITITFYTFFFSSLAIVWFIQPQTILHMVTESSDNLLFTLLYVMISTVLPYLLYTWGLQFTENSTASIIASVEPIMATLIGLVLFSETMSWQVGLGVVLVLVSIVICNLPKKNTEKK